ncbi:hypothetical protein AVEN_252229-1 [Araneus ventricosus]|uniref:Uncharacterized protein n=1 Tax=Araneus ventricosus TaxID=182803 RepID=A0A4Y2JBY6_ARAVE|nr:hypothetical protein AVEN_252229-1 [Araneus ventricosus]
MGITTTTSDQQCYCQHASPCQAYISAETLELKQSFKGQVTARIHGKRHPSAIIYDLRNDVPEADVISVTRNFKHVVWEGDFRISFKLRGRKHNFSHWVLESPVRLLRQLKALKRLIGPPLGSRNSST